MKRGAVYNVFNVKFPNKTKSKYCVLMENYVDGAADIMVVFTTSRTEFDYQSSSVKVQDGAINGISGETLIQCSNYFVMPTDVILNKNKSKYLCQLSPDIMKRVNDAIAYIVDIDEATLIRMLE